MFLEKKPISQILLLFTAPLLLLLVGLQGGVALYFSFDALQMALGRAVQTRTMAVSYEISSYLQKVRYNALLLADFAATDEGLGGYLNRVGGLVESNAVEVVVVLADGRRAHYVRSGEHASGVWRDSGEIGGRPDGYDFLSRDIKGLRVGEVAVSRVVPARVLVQGPFESELTSMPVIRFSTPVKGPDGGVGGALSLLVAADHLGTILTYLQSDDSPLQSFQRRPARRFSYFADPRGWILYESASEQNKTCQPVQSRQDVRGTLGLPGMAGAFLPSDEYRSFWSGIAGARKKEPSLTQHWEHGDGLFFPTIMMEAGAPVLYRISDDAPPQVWGVAFSVDRSLLPHVLGSRQAAILCAVGVAVLAVSALVLYFVGRFCGAPLLRLARRVESAALQPSPEPVEEVFRGYEVQTLQRAVNAMIRTMGLQAAEIEEKTRKLTHYANLQQVDFAEELSPAQEFEHSALGVLKGSSESIRRLKADIGRAAQVDADILIEGETGTGKQLTAEAVHKASRRCNGPLVPINCGALDENLLLDALFGHRKGAYSGAETDRDGAFVHAHGGTLFLDEIQSASSKVQQALLRAIASRRIRPLGADAEYAVDVRVICATNVDLQEEIAAGRFRQDLYYRIKVLSLRTPPLREHLESIPALTAFFLDRAREVLGLPHLALTKGAMQTLMQYSWPGNVRELENCILQAAVNAREGLIYSADIPVGRAGEPAAGASQWRPFAAGQGHGADGERRDAGRDSVPAGGQGDEPYSAAGQAMPEAPPARGPVRGGQVAPAGVKDAGLQGLNERQIKALEHLRTHRSMTRREYMALFTYDISDRTAGRDLQGLFERGLVTRSGAGPATAYRLAV